MLGPMSIGALSSGAAAAEPFVGPFDGYSNIEAAYSTRRLLSSYTGNLIRVRRALDDAEQDFGYDANGDLLVAALASFLSGSTGFVKTWYDQSGNGNNVTQATPGNQPQYAASAINTLPAVRFVRANSTSLVSSAFAAELPQPNTYFMVGTALNGNDGVTEFFFDGIASGKRNGLFKIGGENLWCVTSSTTVRGNAAADANNHIFDMLFKSSVGKTDLAIDGAQDTEDRSSGTEPLSGIKFGIAVNDTVPLDGYIAEFVCIDGEYDFGVRQDIVNEQGVKYGITTADRLDDMNLLAWDLS